MFWKKNSYSNSRSAWQKTVLVLAGLAGATALAGLVAGPFIYEFFQNEGRQNSAERSFARIAENRFYNCDPAAAGAGSDSRKAHLESVANNAFQDVYPKWNEPMVTFRRGTDRLTWHWPVALKRQVIKLPGFSHVTPEARSYSYHSPLDDAASSLQDLAALGIGVCFDSNLSAINAGSAFVPSEGLVTLNPAQQDQALAINLRRQLARLDGALVEPFGEVAKTRDDATLTFRQRATALNNIVETAIKGPVMILPAGDDPSSSRFVALDPNRYAPPLVKQEEKKEAAPKAVTPAAPVKPVKSLKPKA